MSGELQNYIGKTDETRSELEEELDKIKGKIDEATGRPRNRPLTTRSFAPT